MLVPLETLPGWPKVEDPSALEVLGLLVLAPIVVIAVVALIARVHHATRGNVGVPAVANQPVWVNGRRIEPATQDEGSRDAIEGGYEAVARRAARTEEENVGGAGARW